MAQKNSTPLSSTRLQDWGAPLCFLPAPLPSSQTMWVGGCLALQQWCRGVWWVDCLFPLSLSLFLSYTQCCKHKVGTLLQLRFKFGPSVKMALFRLTHVAVMFFIIPVLGDRDNQSQVVLDSGKELNRVRCSQQMSRGHCSSLTARELRAALEILIDPRHTVDSQ